MKITEKTVFPIFTKGNNHYYCLLFDMAIVFGKTDFSIVREYKKIRNQDEEITKEQFIEANNALLEKTGLINLFDLPKIDGDYRDFAIAVCKVKQLTQRLEIAINHDKEQVEQIEKLKLQRNNYENINSELESEIFKLKSLLKHYL